MQPTHAVIGAGRLGRALGLALQRQGYAVRFGVPEPSRHADLENSVTPVMDVQAAIESAEVAVLATPFAAALALAGDRPNWEGRVLVDATNPVAAGLAGLQYGTTTSGAQQIALRARGARVVKAFNTTGYENYARPQTTAGGLFMPVAGDDLEARQHVLAMAASLGFDAVDLGGLAAARYIEPFAMVWIEMAMRLGHSRRFGFVRASLEANT